MRKIKTYNELKYNLVKEITRGRLLDSKRVERGIGKSNLLFKSADENGFVIIVKTRSVAVMLNKEFDTDIYYPISMLNELRGRRNMMDVLLEEGLSLEEEKACRKFFNVVGGYSLNYNGGK